MTKIARIQDGLVVELATLPSGVDLADAYHPDAGFVVAGSGISVGMSYADGRFGPPPPPPLEDVRETKDASINAKRDAIVAGGYRHNFGGTLGSRILDQRDARDETAWLVVDREASKLPPETPFPIRDARNDTFVTTAGAAVEAMGAMARWRMAVSKRSWDLKDAVAAAKTVAALDKIDLNEGWPA